MSCPPRVIRSMKYGLYFAQCTERDMYALRIAAGAAYAARNVEYNTWVALLTGRGVYTDCELRRTEPWARNETLFGEWS